jgi:two-component system, LytTR family, sensor kinase
MIVSMFAKLQAHAWGRWFLFMLGWAAISLLFAPEAYLSFFLRKTPLSWTETLELTVVNSGIALLFIPAVVWLTRRAPLERKHWRRAVLVHVPGCILFSLGHSALYALACHAWTDVGGTLFYRFHPNLITYWAAVGFTHAFDYFQKYQDRERQVVDLRLELLRAQLQPHFLFNTLHTISAMVHHDVGRADQMINRLSHMLRLTLDTIGAREVRLSDEIHFVQVYLDIERERFGERLATTVEASQETFEALVPAMLLQPLVENCVRHGLGAQQSDASITLRAARIGDRLVLSVIDNGSGLKAQDVEEGIGLSITRKRLDELYPDRHVFTMSRNEPRGVIVTVEIPFRTASAIEPVIATSISHEYSDSHRRRRAVGTL